MALFKAAAFIVAVGIAVPVTPAFADICEYPNILPHKGYSLKQRDAALDAYSACKARVREQEQEAAAKKGDDDETETANEQINRHAKAMVTDYVKSGVKTAVGNAIKRQVNSRFNTNFKPGKVPTLGEVAVNHTADSAHLPTPGVRQTYPMDPATRVALELEQKGNASTTNPVASITSRLATKTTARVNAGARRDLNEALASSTSTTSETPPWAKSSAGWAHVSDRGDFGGDTSFDGVTAALRQQESARQQARAQALADAQAAILARALVARAAASRQYDPPSQLQHTVNIWGNRTVTSTVTPPSTYTPPTFSTPTVSLHPSTSGKKGCVPGQPNAQFCQ